VRENIESALNRLNISFDWEKVQIENPTTSLRAEE
jgi:hypothetical protein